MNPAPINVLLVDDHAIVREGYRALLSRQEDLRVVAEAADGDQAYQMYREHLPDVTIIDLAMPGQGGMEAIRRIRQRWPDARVLVFSMHQNAAFVEQAFGAGARGYVTKSSLPDELLQAVREVGRGRQALSPDVAQVVALGRLSGERGALAELTAREFEVLRLLVEAKPTVQIAEALHVTPKTVANTHYQIKRKLGVETDIELVRLAVRLRVVDMLDL